MPGHTKKKREAGKIGPGGESPKGGKPKTGKDIMDKAKKITPLDPNAQNKMPKGKKESKGKAKDQKEKKIPGKMKALPKYGKMPIKKHKQGHGDGKKKESGSERRLREAGGITPEMKEKYKKYKEAGGTMTIAEARRINFRTKEQTKKVMAEERARQAEENKRKAKKVRKERMSEDGGLVFKETDAVINPNVRRREKEREMKEKKALPKHSKVKPALYQQKINKKPALYQQKINKQPALYAMKPKIDGMPKFTYAAMEAKKAGKKSFEYAGKTFPVKKGTYGSDNKALYKSKMPAMYKLGVKGLNALDK